MIDELKQLYNTTISASAPKPQRAKQPLGSGVSSFYTNGGDTDPDTNGRNAGLNTPPRSVDLDPFAYRGGYGLPTTGAQLAAPVRGFKSAPGDGSDNISDGGLDALERGVSTPEAPAAPQGQDVSKFNWQDMAKQIAAMSQGRSVGVPVAPQQMGGWNALTDHAEEINAERTRRWAVDNTDLALLGPKARAKLMASLAMNEADNATRRAGYKLQHAAQMAGQGVTSRGQDLSYNAQMAGQGVTSRGQDMNAAAHLATAAMASEDRRANNRDTLEAQAPYRESQVEANKASAAYNQQRIKELERDTKRAADPHRQFLDERKSIKDMVDSGIFTADEARQRLLELEAGYRAHVRKSSNGGKSSAVAGYADGGAIDAASNLGSQGGYGSFTNSKGVIFGDGGSQPIEAAYGANRDGFNTITPSQQALALNGFSARAAEERARTPGTDEYRLTMFRGINDALEKSRANDKFYGPAPLVSQAQFERGRRQNADWAAQSYGYAFADGGPINVSGRQVLGPGTGKSDSIPAVIDGEQPAALSTGEFVMPVEAVQHFGLDRLNKMVAQARKGLDTGRGQA